MSKKKIIIITIILILLIVVGLWIGGIIPKCIARIVATNYLKNNFPKKQFEYVGIEWSSSFDGYILRFKDEKENEAGFIINGKYLPISVGQGMNAIEQNYREEFGGEKENSSENIEIKSAENFEILFKDRQPIDSYNKIYAILDKSETKKYNYSIYAYDGSVNIKINGKEYSLKEALLENKITMEDIINKANNDFPNAVSYDDGGSTEYRYDNYTIIKCNTLNGNRDVYIGTKDMTLNDVL